MTQQSDKRREQVLAAAVEQFAADGLQCATTGQIAAASGISQSYVMHLFGSKKGLFLAAVEEGTRRLGDLLDQAPAPGKGEEDAVATLASSYNALIREHPSLMRLQLQSWAAATSDDEIREACAAHFRGLTERAARRLGVTRADVSPLMAALTFFNVTVALDLQQEEDCAVATLLERIVPSQLPAGSGSGTSNQQ